MVGATRREIIQSTGLATLSALVSNLAAWTPSDAQSEPTSFNIDEAFAKFMRDIGGSPADGGGRVTFSGRDPIVRSHFRIATSMALPAMAAGVGAAAVWKERTGEGQDLKVDLRESMYNVNPILGLIL
jgi:hypothetical protein